MPELVTIGDAFYDIFLGPIKPVVLSENIKTQIGDNFVETQEVQILAGIMIGRRTNIAPKFETDGGGSAANVAVAASKLGLECGAVIRLGKDEYGRSHRC